MCDLESVLSITGTIVFRYLEARDVVAVRFGNKALRETVNHIASGSVLDARGLIQGCFTSFRGFANFREILTSEAHFLSGMVQNCEDDAGRDVEVVEISRGVLRNTMWQFFERCPKLKVLDVFDAMISRERVRHWTGEGLEVLRLGYSPMFDIGRFRNLRRLEMYSLADATALAELETLSELRLYHTRICPLRGEHWRTVVRRLRSLELVHCHICPRARLEEPSHSVLTEVVQYGGELESLLLYKPDLGFQTAWLDSWIHASEQRKRRLVCSRSPLKSLYFQSPFPITDSVIEAISRAGEALETLRIIGGTEHVSRFAVDELMKRCPVLRDLALPGCRGMTDSVVQKMVETCTHLQILRVQRTPFAASLGVRFSEGGRFVEEEQEGPQHRFFDGGRRQGRFVEQSPQHLKTIITHLLQKPPRKDLMEQKPKDIEGDVAEKEKYFEGDVAKKEKDFEGETSSKQSSCPNDCGAQHIDPVDLPSHLDICPNQKIRCILPGCDVTMERSEMWHRHFAFCRHNRIAIFHHRTRSQNYPAVYDFEQGFDVPHTREEQRRRPYAPWRLRLPLDRIGHSPKPKLVTRQEFSRAHFQHSTKLDKYSTADIKPYPELFTTSEPPPPAPESLTPLERMVWESAIKAKKYPPTILSCRLPP